MAMVVRAGRKKKIKVSLPSIGFNGKYEPVLVKVENPLMGALGENPETETTRNIRESPLERWRCRNEIDGAQYAAGERLREAWEAVQGGGPRAVDTTKERVDGGAIANDGISDKRLKGAKILGEAQQAIGPHACALVSRVVGNREFPTAIAGGNQHRAHDIAVVVKFALNGLAACWGFYAIGREGGRNAIRASHPYLAGAD